MASACGAFELALLCLAFHHVRTIQLTISTHRAHLDQSGDNLTVMCQADGPITHCQFNFVKDERSWEGPLLDLSRGVSSKMIPSLLSQAITGYGYSGSGLKNGQCGITLNLTGPKKWMMGCRVQSAKDGWKYAIMSIVADDSLPIPVTVSPRSIVVLPGASASLLCKANGPLKLCRMTTPGLGGAKINLDEGADSAGSTSLHRYYGAGPESGECGITYSRVTEGINSYVFCDMATEPGNFGSAGIPFVVARRPNEPVLTIVSGRPALAAGSKLQASCLVHGGRPVANITWYLGNELLRNDDNDNSYDQVWRWPTSQQRINQILSRKVEPSDDGKELRCVADHVTLSQPMVARTIIKVNSPPGYATTKPKEPIVPHGNGAIVTVRPGISSTNRPYSTTSYFVSPHLEREQQTGCPPLSSQTVKINCTLAEEEVDCTQPLPVATVAVLACKPGFVEHSSINYWKVTCMKGMKWNREVFNCIPDCGRRNRNIGTELISNGNYSRVGEFPWHVGIYSISSIETEQICGGSLISPNFVVSAAHCVWDKTRGVAYPAGMFKMAAGKHFRAWNDGDTSVQLRNVEQVIPNRLFRGRNSNFAADIVLLKPATPFHINAKVNIVCIDWKNHFGQKQLVEGKTGVVAGWGYTEKGTLTDLLKYVDLPFVSPLTCLESLEKELQNLWSTDRICAGFINKSTSVCKGDSGGGLVFLNPGTDKYYLRGIVSIAFSPASHTGKCYSQHYTGFTKFSDYTQWTQENV